MDDSVGVEAGGGECAHHGVYSNHQCLCDFGWGSANCSVSLTQAIGHVYAIRWVVVIISTLIAIYILLKLYQVLRHNMRVTIFQSCPGCRMKNYVRLFNTRAMVLVLMILTVILIAANWIDPFCQTHYHQDEHSILSMSSVTSALLGLMMMIRLLADTYVKFQPLRRKSVQRLNVFFFISASVFCANIVLWATSTLFMSSTDTHLIFGTIYLISGAVFVVVLNVGGCCYISSTLGPLARYPTSSTGITRGPTDAQLSARHLLRVMRGVQVCSLLCLALFISVSFADPLRQNLLFQFMFEFTFHTLILIACFATARSIGERRNSRVAVVVTILTNPPSPTNPTNPSPNSPCHIVV